MQTRRILLAAIALALAAPAFALAQTPAAAPAPVAEAGVVRVALTTPEGVIVLQLEQGKAPITVGNFLKYVDRKLYDGASFYRASTAPGGPKDYGLLQGGLQNDPKKVLPPIAHESTLKTGLSNTDGAIAMGRHAPGTAQADWFICVGDQAYLDADPKDPKNPGFAAFGRVVEGMDVVKKILAMPVDPNRGEGAMKGEMLVKPVRIVTARRVAP
ncbi:peptidylprolyl isomerase [Phenylobacterium sp.]|jgi:peptidyl-prolyl cis-trans isomerase A (cyclophilin A)|uniref:peptidylprolyl isomerase n=1 Tax=Phenylobacterium sp. TaxID=1871053 RepID=UPI002F91CFB1